MSAAELDRARYAINTYSYTMSHTATDCLTRLADRGYTEFELMMYAALSRMGWDACAEDDIYQGTPGAAAVT